MMGTAIASRAKANEVPEVDKVLTKRNYGKWKNYMKNVLLSKCLWEVVDGSESIGSRSYKTKNHNALITIRISCGEEMLDHAREAWLKLADKLEGAVTSTMERKKGIDNVDHVLLTVSFNLVERNRYILSGNYEIWKDCMQTYLKGRGLWGFMEESVISDHVKDEEALDAIKLSCGSEMLSYILYMDCARHAWEKLAEVAALSTTEEGNLGDFIAYRIFSQINKVTELYCLLHTLSRNGRGAHVKTRTKTNKQYPWKALGEDVCILTVRRNVQSMNLTDTIPVGVPKCIKMRTGKRGNGNCRLDMKIEFLDGTEDAPGGPGGWARCRSKLWAGRCGWMKWAGRDRHRDGLSLGGCWSVEGDGL
ncbi:uncharacterized protein LOC113309034 [Papaver somniferum]|uniref:uncharacterized protein LOC113309034 n=1 Tax=Papaver somniferum TaxID=3469 RepID=UPI000E701E3D|nr:uncharacterized protein LOC113309034 [Papaver somniferum]